MRSQLEKNKETLMDEIEALSCEKMTDAVAARLSAYRGAYKALCLAEGKEYGDAEERSRTDDQPAYTPELDGDTEFERVIMSIPTDRAHMVEITKILNNHMESLAAVNNGAYKRIISRLKEVAKW